MTKQHALPILDSLKEYLSGWVALSDEEFALLAQTLEVRNFDKKQQLVRPGETELYLNFIVKGLAIKYFIRGRDSVITQIARDGDFITSSVSFLSGRPSNCYVETLEACTFLSLPKEDLEKLCRESRSIERLARLMITHFFLQQQIWEQDYKRFDTKERFAHFVKNNPDLLQRVQQKYVASYLNMKPETFSRFKRALATDLPGAEKNP